MKKQAKDLKKGDGKKTDQRVEVKSTKVSKLPIMEQGMVKEHDYLQLK